MAVLTTKRRSALRSSVFGLPGVRKYPMPDRSHAANAKARATQQYNRGNLSTSQLRAIHSKANRIQLVGLHFSVFTHPDDMAIDAELYESLVKGERERYDIDKVISGKTATSSGGACRSLWSGMSRASLNIP